MPDRITHVRISAILLDAGVVTREQIDAALARQLTTGLKIGETLVELGAATEEDIGWALARQLELPFVDPRPEALDRELLLSFPPGLLQRLDAVPLVRDDSSLSVAVSDPLDGDLVRDLELAGRRPLRLSVATPSAIRRILRDVLGPTRDRRGASAPGYELGSGGPSGASLLLLQLGNARRAGATEIHFLPRPGSLDLFHRIGSRLVPAGAEPAAALAGLLARLEDLGMRMPDDGSSHARSRVVCGIGSESMALDVSLLRGAEGTSVVLDLSVVPERPPLLEDLGLDPVELASLRGALEASAGLGIVTGPPRAGGTTTLGCLAREAETSERRLLLAESGGEPAAGPARWLEAAVGQNADLVVLDGILQGDALRVALGPEAAGRLLLVRTDWTDTFCLLEHLASRPRERVALADRLRFVIQQRMLRGPAAESGRGPRWGGRWVLFEVLLPGDALRAAIRGGPSAEHLRAAAFRDGFQPMAQRFQTMLESGLGIAADAPRIQA